MMTRLRAETRVQHEALEQLLAPALFSSTLPQYKTVLEGFWRFYHCWEQAARTRAPSSLRPMVENRRKLPLLAADLRALSAQPPAEESIEPAPLPDLSNEAECLGSMYVVEGATLGGQLIARRVEQHLHLAQGRGYSFFQSYGKSVGQQWRDFAALVDAMPEEAGDSMVRAAQQTFAAFAQCLSPSLEACRL